MRPASSTNSRTDLPVATASFGPTDPTAHFEFGLVMVEDGNLDKAIAGFREALELDPCHGMALYHLGYALQKKGKLDEAIEHLERCPAGR